MRKKKVRKIKFTKLEKILYTSAILCLACSVLLNIFFNANIGNLKLGVEKLNLEVRNQEKKNESLEMKVSELTSFDNVQGVVKDLGLAYNKDNIVIIDE